MTKKGPKLPKPQNNIGFLPPGATKNRQARDEFRFQFDRHFQVPNRIARAPTQLVEAVNDFHFAMMNDIPRNEFYYNILKKHITPETGVLEIGAGSGLLSMMAAQLGAKWVVAVEGSPEMSELASKNVKANGFEKKIKVMNMMSTDLEVKHLPEKPHILVSEIFGTMLLGESALDYIADIRDRKILRQDAKILPQFGTQYAVPIECPVLESICSVKTWNGLDLHHVTALKDTSSVVFTKKYGFRMSSMPYVELTEPIPVLDIDFAQHSIGFSPLTKNWKVKAKKSGIAHGMLYFWKSHDGDQMMSTDPKDTLQNFPRDMQWGQALQLLDADQAAIPKDVHMTENEEYDFVCHTSDDHVVMQLNMIGQSKAVQNEEMKQKETA